MEAFEEREEGFGSRCVDSEPAIVALSTATFFWTWFPERDEFNSLLEDSPEDSLLGAIGRLRPITQAFYDSRDMCTRVPREQDTPMLRLNTLKDVYNSK
jgi:hypothetical protein